MNARRLLAHLFEDEYAPEGYVLLDTVRAGDYELKLWKGNAHVNGKPIRFNEVSLNAVGRSFDPESQNKRFTGGTHALGHRFEFLEVVSNWISTFGDLYIGSYNPEKLALYHRLFTRYLKKVSVSDVYAPFDECEGKPEYFHVTNISQKLLYPSQASPVSLLTRN